VTHGASRGWKGMQHKLLSPGRGAISPAARPSPTDTYSDAAPAGAREAHGGYSLPTACTVGQRTSPLPRLAAG